MTVVSVIIPTYQRPRHLLACLKAIEAQVGSFQIEVCIVNDGGQPLRLNETSHRLSLKWCDLPVSVGQVAARNKALEMATGDFIAFCDDDDRWLPNHVRTLLDACDDKQPSFAYTDTELVWMNFREDAPLVIGRRPFAWKDPLHLLRKYNPIAPSSVMLSRGLIETVGSFDEEVSHYWDWDYWLRASQLSVIRRVPQCETLYAVQVDGGNQSADPTAMRPALLRLIEKHELGQLPSSNFGRMLDDEYLTHEQAQTTVVWNGTPTIWG